MAPTVCQRPFLRVLVLVRVLGDADALPYAEADDAGRGVVVGIAGLEDGNNGVQIAAGLEHARYGLDVGFAVAGWVGEPVAVEVGVERVVDVGVRCDVGHVGDVVIGRSADKHGWICGCRISENGM